VSAAPHLEGSGRPRFIAGLLLVVVIAIYWPGLGGGYTFDDFPNIVDNPALHVETLRARDWIAAAFSSPASDLQRPLAMLTFAINHYFFALDAWWMKLGNLAVHLLNVILVGGLVRRLLRSLPSVRDADRVGLYITAAWAVAPISLMAVLFVVQRMESLSHVFVFAGLWLYLIGRERLRDGRGGGFLIWLALGGGVTAGVLAKESAALLPVYAASLEATVFGFRRRDGQFDRRVLAAFAALLVVPTIVGLAWLLPKMLVPALWQARDFTLAERLLTEPRVVLDYLRWIALPNLSELSLYHDDYPVSRGWLTPATTLPALAGIVALGVASLALMRRRPLAALGLQWFLGAQLITATVIPLELVFEHRNYFASLGVFLVLADLLLLAPRHTFLRYAGGALACGLLVIATVVTHLRAREWSDPLRFASTEASKHPDSPRATFALAHALIVLHDHSASAVPASQVLAALDRARAVPGGSILPQQASLVFAARFNLEPDPQWWVQLREKLVRRPPGAQDIAALAAMTECMVADRCHFPPEQMVPTFTSALSHGPQAILLSAYGNYALNELGDGDLALRLLREAVSLSPREAQHHINLARLLIALKQFDEAQREIDAVRRIGALGQNESRALELDARLLRARQEKH
jgi:hypothetical protein